MLPRVIVSEILHCESDVFLVARYGTVEDLTRLIVAGEAGLHVRDTRGWSLLHVSMKPMQNYINSQLTFEFLVLVRGWKPSYVEVSHSTGTGR